MNAAPIPSSAGRTVAPGITSAGAPVRVGKVALQVRDLEATERFYRDVLGLDAVESGAGLRRLGLGGRALLELHHAPGAAPAARAQAGLFHTAFLVPERADLAAWLVHAAGLGVRLDGASDHLVSEAVYLSDPEGNGIEIYRDRPSEAWPAGENGIAMATDRLDLRALAGEARPGARPGLAEGSIVGHVHLQVGALEAAERFYAGTLGLDIACRYPGASFFGSGGYHHHLAGNVWNSRGAGPRAGTAAGLAHVELEAEPAAFAALAERAPAAAEGHLAFRDPWNTEIRVVRR